ncbi:MAG: hypothetical protein ABIH28_03335 [archaeon]
MIEICKATRKCSCQICKRPIEIGILRVRCVVAGTHSESLCLNCYPQESQDANELFYHFGATE